MPETSDSTETSGEPSSSTRQKVITVARAIFVVALTVGLTYAGLPVWGAILISLAIDTVIQRIFNRCKRDNPAHSAPADAIAAALSNSSSPTPVAERLQKSVTFGDTEHEKLSKDIYGMMLQGTFPIPVIDFSHANAALINLTEWSQNASQALEANDELTKRMPADDESEAFSNILNKAVNVFIIHATLVRHLTQRHFTSAVVVETGGEDENAFAETDANARSLYTAITTELRFNSVDTVIKRMKEIYQLPEHVCTAIKNFAPPASTPRTPASAQAASDDLYDTPAPIMSRSLPTGALSPTAATAAPVVGPSTDEAARTAAAYAAAIAARPPGDNSDAKHRQERQQPPAVTVAATPSNSAANPSDAGGAG